MLILACKNMWREAISLAEIVSRKRQQPKECTKLHFFRVKVSQTKEKNKTGAPSDPLADFLAKMTLKVTVK